LPSLANSYTNLRRACNIIIEPLVPLHFGLAVLEFSGRYNCHCD